MIAHELGFWPIAHTALEVFKHDSEEPNNTLVPRETVFLKTEQQYALEPTAQQIVMGGLRSIARTHTLPGVNNLNIPNKRQLRKPQEV